MVGAGEHRVVDLDQAVRIALKNFEAIRETPLQIDALRQAVGEIEMQAVLVLARSEAIDVSEAELDGFDRLGDRVTTSRAFDRLRPICRRL